MDAIELTWLQHISHTSSTVHIQLHLHVEKALCHKELMCDIEMLFIALFKDHLDHVNILFRRETQTQKVVQKEIWEQRCLLKALILQFTLFWMV